MSTETTAESKVATSERARTAHARTPFDPAARDEIPNCWGDDARRVPGSYRFGEGVRPWNWLELDDVEAEKLWSALIGFATFLNSRYGTRNDHKIPPCWAEHGGIVEELTTLMFARWHAFGSAHASVGGAQYWHSYTLPSFFTRLSEWLGDDLLSCQQGLHKDYGDPGPAHALSWADRTEVLSDLDVSLRRAEAQRGKDENEPRLFGIEVPFLEEKDEQSPARKAIP